MQQKGGVDKIGRKRKKDGIEGMSRKKRTASEEARRWCAGNKRKGKIMLHMASLRLRLHLLANSQTINHPPDSAYHSVHTHTHKHAFLFIIPVLSATQTQNSSKNSPFQRSHSGVNITAHTHPLTHTTPLFKRARLYTHPNHHHRQPQSTRIHIQYMCTLAHTCSPKRDSWSYQTKA